LRVFASVWSKMLSFFFWAASSMASCCWTVLSPVVAALNFLLALMSLICLMTPARFCLVWMPFSKTRSESLSPRVRSRYSRSLSLARSSFSVSPSLLNGLLL
jgi:hypothetical protein